LRLGVYDYIGHGEYAFCYFLVSLFAKLPMQRFQRRWIVSN
jgi:hypothetical protein